MAMVCGSGSASGGSAPRQAARCSACARSLAPAKPGESPAFAAPATSMDMGSMSGGASRFWASSADRRCRAAESASTTVVSMLR